MSAFVVSHDHIDAILTFADDSRLKNDLAYRIQPSKEDWLTLTDIGRVLLKENVRSVRHRYPNDAEDDLPGKVGETVEGYEFRRFEPFNTMPLSKKVAWVLKACSCLDYQSCETDDYEQSVAHKLIRMIEARAINRLPHYEDAPWGIDRERASERSRMNDDYDDRYDDDVRSCCREACIVTYHRSVALPCCYSGTLATWEEAHAKGYFHLTDSVLIIGAVA